MVQQKINAKNVYDRALVFTVITLYLVRLGDSNTQPFLGKVFIRYHPTNHSYACAVF